MALMLCALVAFVVTVLVLSGRSLIELYLSANLARYEAMTTSSNGPHRFFVFTEDATEVRQFAEREALVNLVTYNPMTRTTTLELATPDAATLERLRALPSTGLVLNASAALLCR